MSHSLRAKIKCLRYKGIITDKECERIRMALANEDMLDKIRDEIEHKAHSGQWSDATMYGMLKAVAIIDRYKAESEDEQ